MSIAVARRRGLRTQTKDSEEARLAVIGYDELKVNPSGKCIFTLRSAREERESRSTKREAGSGLEASAERSGEQAPLTGSSRETRRGGEPDGAGSHAHLRWRA